MNRYEKLILVVVALLLISKLGAFGRDILLAQTYGAGPIPYEVKRNWEIISFLMASALNLGVGAWLYLEAVKEKQNRWIWATFGLFFGIMGLTIFYLVQIFTELRGHART
jgi:hypothetical protein